jgi:hypothetical protein
MPPSPKHPSARARRNRHSTATELVVRDPNEVQIPPLPPRYVIRDGERLQIEWHPLAIQTWQEVWSSPMVAEFLEADTGGVRALLLLENDMWEKSERGRSVTELAAEIARVRKTFGLAPMGRRSLQWTISQTAEVQDRIQRRALRPSPTPIEIEATVEEVPSLPEGEVAELLEALE